MRRSNLMFWYWLVFFDIVCLILTSDTIWHHRTMEVISVTFWMDRVKICEVFFSFYSLGNLVILILSQHIWALNNTSLDDCNQKSITCFHHKGTHGGRGGRREDICCRFHSAHHSCIHHSRSMERVVSKVVDQEKERRSHPDLGRRRWASPASPLTWLGVALR